MWRVWLEIIWLPFIYVSIYLVVFKASRGAGAQSVTVKRTGCGFDPHLIRREV